MAKKKTATKTLRPKAAKKTSKAKPAKKAGKRPAAGRPTTAVASGDNPAAVFARKFAQVLGTKPPMELVKAAGVGETTVYGILGAKLKSPPKASTVRLLDDALKAGGDLLKSYGEQVGRAAVCGWL